MRTIIKLIPLLAVLSACSVTGPVYKAYFGEVQEDVQLSIVSGARFLRQDLINRYVDAVRFMSINGTNVENSRKYESIQVAPGPHNLMVYFDWDLGSQRGLAPALVNYAAYRDTMSRELTFHARAGESYIVKAEPVFEDEDEDITSMAYVNFWIEDLQGNEIVSREQGRYKLE